MNFRSARHSREKRVQENFCAFRHIPSFTRSKNRTEKNPWNCPHFPWSEESRERARVIQCSPSGHKLNGERFNPRSKLKWRLSGPRKMHCFIHTSFTSFSIHNKSIFERFYQKLDGWLLSKHRESWLQFEYGQKKWGLLQPFLNVLPALISSLLSSDPSQLILVLGENFELASLSNCTMHAIQIESSGIHKLETTLTVLEPLA